MYDPKSLKDYRCWKFENSVVLKESLIIEWLEILHMFYLCQSWLEICLTIFLFAVGETQLR